MPQSTIFKEEEYMAKNRYVGSYPVIGIRPIIDGRRGPMKLRESLEGQVMAMAEAAKKLFEDNLYYSNGDHVKVVIADSTIGVPGPVYLDRAAEKLYRAGVLSVHAGEYLHKSRFTGAVFPDQCHDLPRLYLKPGVIKRVHAGKILLYTVHSQNRFSHYGFTFLYLIKKQSVEDGLNGENEPFRVFV